MKTKETVGVVVGRFQVPALHEGHRHFLNYVTKRHKKVLVLVGVCRTYPTKRNPLDFKTREAMLEKEYPGITILPVFDCRSDQLWSARLDRRIEENFPGYRPTLYGSRKSFLPRYSGANRIHEVPALPRCNGTTLRNKTATVPGDSPDFRAGIIHCVHNRPALSYQAVDIALIHPTKRLVLLCVKHEDDGKKRFIGGFVDPKDESLEYAARRECYEETSSIGADDFCFLGSARIDDWRYRNASDAVMSTLFVATYIFGSTFRKPKAGDDADELVWVPYEKLQEELVPEHRHFGTLLGTYLKQNNDRKAKHYER